jgi:SpoIID/LytB domain protein
VTITGGGYGHGIGMSQYGAYGRALKGKDAEQILEKYYSGAEVASRSTKGSVKVGLLSGKGAVTVTSEPRGDGSGKLSIKLKSAKDVIVTGDPGDIFDLEATGTGGFRIIRNGEKLKRDGETVFGSTDDPLVLRFQQHKSFLVPSGKSHKYAYGAAEVGSYSSGSCSSGHCARLVLRLSMQKYLYGLGEVPSSWPGPALRAQAIAGRTYAFNKKTDALRYPCGCHVLDSTLDQAYIGDSKRTGSGQWWPDWRAAVDDTNNQVILYDGEVVDYALYSASSGGHTESNSAVWGSAQVPYLKPVKDRADKAGGNNPHYVWDPITMSRKQFSNKLNAAFGTGKLDRFTLVKPFGVSGRVTVVNGDQGGVRIKGANKTVRVSGWDVRTALGLKDTLFRVKFGQAVAGTFQAKYDELNGAPGGARSGAYHVPRKAEPEERLGLAQNFDHGRMTYTASLDAVVWQRGPVLEAYDAMGRERSNLGMPASGIWGKDGYEGASYTKGRIIYSPERGAIPILGTFDAAFERNGGVDGKLGLPTKEREGRATLPDGGRRQRFEDGTLYKVGAGGGVFALFGKLDRKYRRLGEASSVCGYPTADQHKEGRRWLADFEFGLMVLRPNGSVLVDCAS